MSEIIRKIAYSILGNVFKNQSVAVPIKLNSKAKILIFRYDKIGDMVVSFPSFELLRAHFPEAEIWVLASEVNSFLLNNYQVVDNVAVFPKNFFLKLKTLFSLRKQKFDVIINYVFYRTTKAGLIANFINPKAIKINIGHNVRDKIYSKLFNVLYPIALRGELPMAEFLCHYICWIFGMQFKPEFLKQYNFNIPEESYARARDFLKKIPHRKILLINISARRKWEVQNYKRLISLVNKSIKDLSIIFIAHPTDYYILEMILAGENENAFSFTTGSSFYDAIALISFADIVFTPDTSIVHFANAFGKPLVMMYYKKDSYMKEWQPSLSKFVCHYSECSNGYSDITPEVIFQSIKSLME
ncbi:MAG: glycosyltransferase family 9 protein [Candidatus Kapaibacteriota bacterium]|jgi:ADP-heptose:LPS heptosyltransferase